MANVVKLDHEKKQNSEERMENFMMRNRIPIICVSLAIVAIAFFVCIFIGVNDSQIKKGLAYIDSVEYDYTKNIASIEDTDLADRQTSTLSKLEKYFNKKNVVGVRANMLAAEIEFSRKNYSEALSYWTKAVDIDKKSYTAYVCYSNMAASYEELNNLQEAATYYAKAAEYKDNLLVTHLLFNLGRVNESIGNYEEAVEAYQKLVSKYPNDTWAHLAQTRLIELSILGKFEE